MVLPLVVSVALLLIADIDAPRHGLIRVSPQNLQSLAKSLFPIVLSVRVLAICGNQGGPMGGAEPRGDPCKP